MKYKCCSYHTLCVIILRAVLVYIQGSVNKVVYIKRHVTTSCGLMKRNLQLPVSTKNKAKMCITPCALHFIYR